MAAIQIRRLAYALGAEIRGVDLRDDLEEVTVAELRRTWLEHQLLCFPGQGLDKAQFCAFAARFGDLETIRPLHRDPETPQIGYLTNRPIGRTWNSYKGGTTWHSDESHTTQPTSATVLLAKAIPEVGGETMFANQYMAWEALSPHMQGIVERLEGIHRFEPRLHGRLFQTKVLPQGTFPSPPAGLPIAHPAVRVHPETGRKALYVSSRVHAFVGMTPEESRPLLDYLKEHAVRYEFCYRHAWRPDDLVMWDNRCLMHLAVCDYDAELEVRHMFRTGVLGQNSGYEYAPAPELAAAPAG